MIGGGPVVAGTAPAVQPAPEQRQQVAIVFMRPSTRVDMLMFLSDDAERFCRSRGLQVSTRYVNLTEENLREFYLGNRQRIARQGHIHKNPESGESVDKAGRKYLEGLVKRFAGERGVYLLVTGPNAVSVVAELFDHGGARYRELFSNADAPRTPDEVEHDLRALSGMTPEAMLHEEAFRAPARV